MPSITINGVPTRIAQAVAAPSNLQNTGAATIYMDTNSAVSPLAYGVAVAPRASVNWSGGDELWAVTDGPETTLSVLYGAEGTTVSEVSAVVTGDVIATIDGPVEADITGPVTVNGTVSVGNVVSTQVTNTVSTNVANTVATTVSGTVNTLVTAPVNIAGTVPITGNVGVTGPVTVTGTVNANVAGNVNAAITGPVSISSGTVNVGGILTPVVVQGGGAILHNANVNAIPAGGSTTITINGPANGTTYYGIDVSWEILTSPAGTTASTVRAYVNGFPGTPIAGTAMRDTSAAEISVIGFSERIDFTVPMRTTFPLTITIDNSNLGGTVSGFLRVTGTSYASPYPVDNMNGWMGVGSLGARVTPALNDYVTIQPSFSTLTLSVQPEVAGLDNVSLQQWNTLTDAYDIQIRRISHSPYYQQTGAAAQWDVLRVSIPPIGQPHRIFFHAAFAGQVDISLSEVSR